MNKTAQIYKLPSPVMAVVHHDDGSLTYSFAPTLYQAQEEARRAGAAEISLSPWQHLNMDGQVPVPRSEGHGSTGREAAGMQFRRWMAQSIRQFRRLYQGNPRLH